MTRSFSPEWVRVEAVKAIASDDDLMDLLVLKGGFALGVAHSIGSRSSLDLDYSVAGGVSDQEWLRRRLEEALTTHFAACDARVFDVRFERKPPIPRVREGVIIEGYNFSFKVVPQSQWDRMGGDLEAIRNIAIGIKSDPKGSMSFDPQSSRSFEIEISAHEQCDGKEIVEVEKVQVFAYTFEMILSEKLRAICQQMPEYANPHRRPRARDFYDVFAIMRDRSPTLSSPAFKGILSGAFAAKGVPLGLIGKIPASRDFHEGDWPAVRSALGAIDRELTFNDVVRAVEDVVRALEPLWNV